MPSPRRVEKLSNLLREELAAILERDIEFPDGMLVTLTRVAVSPDAHYASAMISVLPEKAQKDALEILRKNVYDIQQILNRRLRMRPVPKIRFVPDEGEAKRERVEKSLAELKQKENL